MSPRRARAAVAATAVPHAALPMVLAGHQRALEVGDRVDVHLGSDWPPIRARDVVTGAGFVVDRLSTVRPTSRSSGGSGREPDGRSSDELVVRATRARTLADTVAPSMRLVVVGLNPSLYSADAGIGFARPGNRFWPAALDAGLAAVDRDPDAALRQHRLGMTDLVKRATPRADGLTTEEYRAGLDRVARTVGWLGAGAICFVGLAGWRAAVDRRAVAGVQPTTLGGARVYVMPSTSGVNASASVAQLTDHLAAAAALADEAEAAGPVDQLDQLDPVRPVGADDVG